MAYTKYSLTPADNNAAPPNGAPEGMLPSAVNDTMRDMMSQIRDVGDGIRGGTYTMTAPVITGGSVTGVTAVSTSGNLTFTGTGNRIRGDFSNATFANRVYVQTSTSGGNTSFGLLPDAANATPTTTFEACYSSDPANSSVAQFQVTTTDVRINSGSRGTSSFLPLTMFTGGAERLRIDTSGNVGIGTSSPADKLEVAGNLRLSGSGSSTADNAQIFNASGFGPTINGFNFAIKTGASTTTERMRIDSSGNLLVGQTSATYGSIGDAKQTVRQLTASLPAALFYIGTTGDTGTSAVNIGKFDNNNTTSQIFVKFAINNSGLGAGQINANGSGAAAFGSFSDSRLKENIENLPPQLANITALRPVEFDYIESEGGGHQVGFIAQEMQEIYPDAVGERSDGMLTVTGWNKTEARLVKAIQELKATVDAQAARIAALESK